MRWAFRCCVLGLLLLCGCDDDDGGGGADHVRLDGGRDASVDGSVVHPRDAAAEAAHDDAGPADSGEPDAHASSPDAGRDVSADACDPPAPLDCTNDDCTYAPDYDLTGACNTEASYVLEGTCGAYRYRASGDGFVGGVSYYRIDTGALVATSGYSDENGGCPGISGAPEVVKACGHIDIFGPGNLCCSTKNGGWIETCQDFDGGA